METKRQQKVAKQIQKDISNIFLKEASSLLTGTMTSVTMVRVSSDLSFAKIYLSVFPFDKNKFILETLTANNWSIRKILGSKLKNQLRIVPEIAFYLDDSLEYIENIEKILKNS